MGAIYYPVPDLDNPTAVYPTDDYHYSSYGGGGGEPTGTPSTMPTKHVRRNLQTDDVQAQAGSNLMSV